MLRKMASHTQPSLISKHTIFILFKISFFVLSCLANDFTEDSNENVSNNSSTGSDTSIAIGASRINKTVKAWATPNGTKVIGSPLEIGSIYSAAMVFRLVKTYHARTTSNDPVNEAYYTLQRLGDNVWFNIERVAPFKTFMQWAINTSRITDRFGPDGKSVINFYIQNESATCAPESAFDIRQDLIMSDDANQRIKLNDKINAWFKANENIPVEKLCNRFRGLRCNPSTKQCECENEDMRYSTYYKSDKDLPGKYRDGCYVKAWRSCRHLSLDTTIPSEYKAYHAHHHNMKQFLFRMATPMPKTPRCEKGSYCVDMILNQKRPICWCTSRMYSKDCYNMNGSVPLLPQFLDIRRQFHLMMIPEQDRTTRCLLDAKLDDSLQDLQVLMLDTQQNYIQIFRLMKEVIARRGRNGKFCDFRKGMACDPYRRTCAYRTGCGPGRIMEMAQGRKICLVNNGYPCPTIELQCVRGAECKDFGQGRHCHCNSDRYGDLCRFENPTFFGTLLQSRVSGFVGYHFVNLQELVNHVLAPVERLMTLQYGSACSPFLDIHAMSIVRYLGGVRSVTLEQMDGALGSIQYLVGKDELLCDYRKFLGCSRQGVCEPLISDVVKYEVKEAPKLPGKVKVYLHLRHRARCGSLFNNSDVPPIYQDLIHVKCLPHHQCRRVEGRINSVDKYCLCPVGLEGGQCEVKMPKERQIEIYEVPHPLPGPHEMMFTQLHDEVNH